MTCDAPSRPPTTAMTGGADKGHWLGNLLAVLLLTACGISGGPQIAAGRRNAGHSGAQIASSGARRGRWSATRIASDRVISLSCPSSSFCVAMGKGVANPSQGEAYVYSRGRWSHGDVVDVHTYADSVSCVSSSFCMVVDSLPDISPAGYQGGYAFSYSHGMWSSGQRVDPDEMLQSVSCTSPSFCLAVDPLGSVFAYSDGKWSVKARFPMKSSVDLMQAISCVPRFCMAVDGYGFVYTYDGGRWSSGQASEGREAGRNAISCGSISLCIVVSGNVASMYRDGRGDGAHIFSPYTFPTAVSCASSWYCDVGAVGRAMNESDIFTYSLGSRGSAKP